MQVEIMLKLVLVLASLSSSFALDNGLARTPPMGWLTWERFRCNTDCTNDPDNCIGEKLIKDMADRMVADGYLSAGYEYIIVDDCWPAKSRDSNGRLVADPERFPSGMKALSDYVHNKGLKFGIYEDFGSSTCGGYPGSEFYLEIDAQTFADWGVDYVKLDGCNADVNQMDIGYPTMGFWMNMTGRPMVYSCSWPAYQGGMKDKPNYPLIAKYCNLWRNYGDIQDSWDSVLGILTWYGDDNRNQSDVAGPGNWNDPDMLIIGNFGLSYEQQRVQMAMWAIFASPLIMSLDLRNVRPESKELLLNKNAIAINQDRMGTQGKRLYKIGNLQFFTKAILPTGSFAFAVVNSDTGGTPTKVQLDLAQLGFNMMSGYNLTEVFDGKPLGIYKPGDTVKFTVNPTGVFFGKGVPLKKLDSVLRFRNW